MYKDPYRHYPNNGWSGVFTVWVLRTVNGTEYIIGEHAVPKPEQLKYVVAKIGPIAYEDGQGIDRFKEIFGKAMELQEEIDQEQRQEQRFKKMVEREVEARMPKPAPDPEPIDDAKGGEHG